MELSLAELCHVCGVTAVARLQSLLPHLNAALPEAQINTTLRAAMFLAQVSHESADLGVFEERLSYSAERLMQVWPRRFPAMDLAQSYAHDPERLGNFVYADRLGNGDWTSGDGFRFRGRGAIMLTGFDNYHRFEIETGFPVTAHPEMLAEPSFAFLAAAKFWQWKGLNVAADQGDVLAATKIINGGTTGLADREDRYRRALEIMQPAHS